MVQRERPRFAVGFFAASVPSVAIVLRAVRLGRDPGSVLGRPVPKRLETMSVRPCPSAGFWTVGHDPPVTIFTGLGPARATYRLSTVRPSSAPPTHPLVAAASSIRQHRVASRRSSDSRFVTTLASPGARAEARYAPSCPTHVSRSSRPSTAMSPKTGGSNPGRDRKTDR